jgi:large subunit ribosomal protein L33
MSAFSCLTIISITCRVLACFLTYFQSFKVAKKTKTVLVKLTSTANTGYFLVKQRNPKTQTEKLSFKKYDPVVRKHVMFKEEKIK